MKRKWLLFALVALIPAGSAVWFFYPRPAPLYCLLVFGPEGKTRVWVEWRGDAAYLHRDGDLGRWGERMECESGDWASVNLPGRWARFSTEVTSAEDGTVYHVRFEKGSPTNDPDGQRAFAVYAHVGDPAGPGERYCMIDTCAEERLSEGPARAPVVPFGALEIVPLPRQELVLGKDNDLRVYLGTFQRLEGTSYAWPYNYTLVSHFKGGVSGRPVAEIAFPPAVPGAPPVRARYPLPERC
jgi:hypothetical protein